MVFALIPIVLTLISIIGACVHELPAAGPERSVALTFDDLPATRSVRLDELREITLALLAHFRDHGIPAIGFVNEVKLGVPGEEFHRRALLEAWLNSGHDLGNHTYSHVRLFDTPLREYEADVLRGERVTITLMAARGRRLRYFRHPTLNTGPDLPTKRAFENSRTTATSWPRSRWTATSISMRSPTTVRGHGASGRS